MAEARFWRTVEEAPPSKVQIFEYDSVSEIELKPDSGKKYVLDEILLDGGTYVDIYIKNTVAVRLPIVKNDCKFVPKPGEYSPSYGLLNLLRQYFGFPYFAAINAAPITLRFDTTVTKAVIIAFEIEEAEKIEPEYDPNAAEQPFCQIITHSSDVAATGSYNFDKALAPVGLELLKDNVAVPADLEVEIKGIAFAAVASGSTEFKRLHVWAQRRELFTTITGKGIPVMTSYNLLKFDITVPQFFAFKEPYTLKPGYVIRLIGDAEYDGTNTLAAESAWVVLLGKYRRTG